MPEVVHNQYHKQEPVPLPMTEECEICSKKYPDVLDIDQKKNKIKNNLQSLRKQGKIDIKGKIWKMSNQNT